MEQYKKPFHSFIQPLLNSLQFPTESTSFTPVMPLIDVVETIHNSNIIQKVNYNNLLKKALLKAVFNQTIILFF